MSLKLSNTCVLTKLPSYLTYEPIILRDRVYCCIICPDLPHLAQCPHPAHLIRKQNAMILITPKPPTSASCFLKMLLLPISYSCPHLSLLSTPHIFSSAFVCHCVGRVFERRFPSAVEPTGWRRKFSPKLECRLPRSYSQCCCTVKPSWKLYLTAATLRSSGSRTRATVETLTGLMP